MSWRISTTSLRRLLLLATGVVTALAVTAQTAFTALEQQKISIETPGLFERSDSFTVDFSLYTSKTYCFPLPVGKAEVVKDNNMEIATTQGDAVKAMFDGTVRMSWAHPRFGNIVVLRHGNGLETVYGGNAENRVKVGDRVKAGETVAMVGGSGGRYFCTFAIMVNGGRINPEIILSPKTHRLLQQTVMFKRSGFNVDVSVVEPDPWNDQALAKKKGERGLEASDPFAGSSKFTLNLANIAAVEWCYPLPGAKVISPYGSRGGRRHTGTDLKTVPNDPILAAFDGVVTMSQRYSGYGNCVILRHANGLETLYSHNVKNLVKVGDHVRAGQKIALTGRTGRATTEHLHFEIRVKGRPYNSTLIFNHATHQLKTDKVTFTRNGTATATRATSK